MMMGEEFTCFARVPKPNHDNGMRMTYALLMLLLYWLLPSVPGIVPSGHTGCFASEDCLLCRLPWWDVAGKASEGSTVPPEVAGAAGALCCFDHDHQQDL